MKKILFLLLVSLSAYSNAQLSFIPDKTTGCGPLTVNFTNKSADNGMGTTNIVFRWQISSLNIDTVCYHFSYTFSDASNYEV